MARSEVVKADSGAWPVRGPWPLLAAGVAVGVLVLLLPAWSGTAGVLLRVLLIVAGLLCAGGAVSLRLSFAGQDADDRARSAGVVALAALVPLLGYAATANWGIGQSITAISVANPTRVTSAGHGLTSGDRVYITGSNSKPDIDDPFTVTVVDSDHFTVPVNVTVAGDRGEVLSVEGDSLRLLLAVLTGAAVVGAVLVLLPTVFRRVAISLLVLFHFAGILTAVTSVAPPGSDPPWIVSQAWARVFRPYLQFAYLNNAYHFYSPEPGPPCLLWFHVEYADGSAQWVEIPKREQYETRQEYQRRLALTESTNQLIPVVPAPEKVQERMKMGLAFGIPVYPGLPEGVQYREPNGYSRVMVSAYARHVAHDYPNPSDTGSEVTGVKVYRVVRNMVTGSQMAAGYRPTDPSLLAPYYQGEFDKDGRLKNPQDPFLYWLIPILWMPKDSEHPQAEPVRKPDPEHFEIKDFTRVHANIQTPQPGR